MLEKAIENYLVREVKKRGGTCEKFTSPGRRSVPDRLCILPSTIPPYYVLFFVECKATGKKPTENQLRDHAKRRSLGQKVYVIDSKEGVDALFKDKSDLWRSLV